MESKTVYAYRADALRSIPVKVRSDGGLVIPEDAQHFFGYRKVIWNDAQHPLVFDSPQEALEHALGRIETAILHHEDKAIELREAHKRLEKQRLDAGTLDSGLIRIAEGCEIDPDNL